MIWDEYCMNHESHITPQFLIFLGSSTSNKPSDKRGSHTNQIPKQRAPKPGSATVDWRTSPAWSASKAALGERRSCSGEVIPSLSEVAPNYSSA